MQAKEEGQGEAAYSVVAVGGKLFSRFQKFQGLFRLISTGSLAVEFCLR